jgi:hypothetical protein
MLPVPLPPADISRLTILNPLSKFQQQLTGKDSTSFRPVIGVARFRKLPMDLIDHIIERMEFTAVGRKNRYVTQLACHEPFGSCP